MAKTASTVRIIIQHQLVANPNIRHKKTIKCQPSIISKGKETRSATPKPKRRLSKSSRPSLLVNRVRICLCPSQTNCCSEVI